MSIPGLEDHVSMDAANGQPPPVSEEDEERAQAIGASIRAVLYQHTQTLSDRAFERVEARIADLVDHAAKRVVPKNIRELIETIINVRTAALEDEIRGLRLALSKSETRLYKEIARVENLEFVEPEPEPRPKQRKRRRLPRKR